jgi:hypothetical protein
MIRPEQRMGKPGCKGAMPGWIEMRECRCDRQAKRGNGKGKTPDHGELLLFGDAGV